MAALPSYVKILFDGYAEQRQPVLLRTEMESGPPKQLKNQSRAMVKRPVALLMTKADYALFITWFATTINQGAAWFDFTDPRTATVKQARIVNGDISDAKPQQSHLRHWVVRCAFETWE